MGWEYFNSLPGDRDKPWEWAAFMTRNVRNGLPAVAQDVPIAKASDEKSIQFLVVDEDPRSPQDAPVPKNFDYYSDGSVEE